MSLTPLTPRQRLARGLKYTAVGPVDVTRGVLGLSADSAQATAAELRRRYRSGRLRRELAAAQETLAQELAAVQEAVSSLPEAVTGARVRNRRRKRLVTIGVGVGVVAVGAVTFSIVRRSMKPEPSPLPPSVEVTPKP
ncbi:cell wall synthesis protein CwsA [Mycolicibacterium litorale]|uniref:Cell wall synthesis protein CwsA n=1 Tax=Mycolicibacterium litorale TaxID=758802 RepID=A0A6S6NY84_9MYCO|nr:cell wall synthesis protein CwsA [Mycolicibacterium litorale]BCI50732.1 cell wall synthesis protein CwsA [Mycolicibacterium litorale]